MLHPEEHRPGQLSRRAALTGLLAAASLTLLDLHVNATPAHATPQWRHPFTSRGTIRSPYGMRVHPITRAYKLHTGVDYAPPGAGTRVFAAAAGVVTVAGYHWSWGWWALVDHGEGWTSHYAHLQEGSLAVAAGQSIPISTYIGRVGSTGESTGPHLHVEIRYKGNPVDPAPLVHHAPLAVPQYPGVDMPFFAAPSSTTDQSVVHFPAWSSVSLASSTGFTAVAYNPAGATNIAALAPAASLFSVDAILHFIMATPETRVGVRLGLGTSSGTVQAMQFAVFGGEFDGRIRCNFSSSERIKPGVHKLLLQVFSSTPGVRLDAAHLRVSAW